MAYKTSIYLIIKFCVSQITLRSYFYDRCILSKQNYNIDL
jgi:hypothetical protein